MATQTAAEVGAPGTRAPSENAGKERSVRWVYLWLLFSSLLAVPWMAQGIRGLEARHEEETQPWPGSEPAWSPDGRSIAFVSIRSLLETIYIMDADGTDPRQLLPQSTEFATDYDPDWSQDGRGIAYASNRTGNFEIYVAKLDAGVSRRLTDNEADDENPAWSPDGRQIAFWSDRTGDRDIYVMDADGRNVRNLTHVPNDPADDMWPDWSPDGKYLAFNSNRSGNDDLYIMDSDGGNLRQLTHGEADEVWPRWSPDGKALVFNTATSGRSEIAILHLDVADSPRIESTTVEGSSPAWSPDGDRIAFGCTAEYWAAVCVMAPDGSGLVDLTARLTAEALATAPVSTASYVGAVALPAVLLLVLLIPLGSRLVYVRRHAQQAVALAAIRACSTILLVGMSRGSLIAVWVVVNGGLWLFGGVWGLRQIRRGECWLMRRRGEVSDLPRPWAAKQVPLPAVASSGASEALGVASTEQDERAATVEALRLAMRTGSPQERQWAIESLQALGEIEEF
jgi:dipeptidyl aminopeptidase/acylaminoacyl peptidase